MDMSVQVLNTKAEQGFADHFEAAKPALPGAGAAWAAGVRAEAMRVYSAAGLPHRRIEEWKYTDLRSHLSEAFAPSPAASPALAGGDIDRLLGGLGAIDTHRIVLVDGHVDPESSDFGGLPDGCELLSLADVLAAPPDWFETAFGRSVAVDGNAVLALNTGLMTGGAILRLPDGTVLGKPVHIVHVHASAEPASAASRNLVIAGQEASLTVLESHVAASAAAGQCNAATEVFVGAGANVRHIKDQREAAETTHLSTWLVRLDAGSSYDAFQFSAGAALARNQIFVEFAGEDASLNLNGAFLARGRQHVDTTLVVDHAVPNGISRELFKGVLDDTARGIFQGKIIVRPDAQKTDGKQMAQALLLSETAEFDSKPELEIFADDVICGHGATSGQIDEELLFYLRARGIPEPKARALLIAAFVGEALDQIEDEAVREGLLAASEDWLSQKDL
ncbi:MAG: Fe-S cluster assembly protein SufD [Methyloligellaceae bacterium]